MNEQTKVISTHKYRRVARWHERRLQRRLKAGWWDPEPRGLPGWARGTRVERVDGADDSVTYAVVLTSHRGH
jgi:hypothetical protein